MRVIAWCCLLLLTAAACGDDSFTGTLIVNGEEQVFTDSDEFEAAAEEIIAIAQSSWGDFSISRNSEFGSGRKETVVVEGSFGGSQESGSEASSSDLPRAGDCVVGQTVDLGESCRVPGTPEDFWVDDDGRGHLAFTTAGTGIDLGGSTINGVFYDFKASKQPNGSWLVERV